MQRQGAIGPLQPALSPSVPALETGGRQPDPLKCPFFSLVAGSLRNIKRRDQSLGPLRLDTHTGTARAPIWGAETLAGSRNKWSAYLGREFHDTSEGSCSPTVDLPSVHKRSRVAPT